MQRDRYEHRLSFEADQRCHVASHRSRDGDLATIFQTDCEVARELVVGHRSSRPQDARRFRLASAACRLLGARKGEPACRAAAFSQELHLDPAVGAEAVNVAHDRAAAGAAWRKREIQCPARCGAENRDDHRFLSPGRAQRTSAAMPDLFDMELRAWRRDRAARLGPELFLYERALEDCLERLRMMPRKFGRALIIGCPDPRWS